MTRPPVPTMSDEELARHGIERVPADAYLVGGYRYSQLADALAASARIARS
jgi:hypothetical protein